MSQILELLNTLNEFSFISGAEHKELKSLDFSHLISGFQMKEDLVGNILFYKKSNSKNAKKILVEAHLDTIGFCVKSITETGFLSISPCGGFDAKILPGTEILSVKNRSVKGVICAIPPHLSKTENKEKRQKEELFADFGFSSRKEAEEVFFIGDTLSFASPVTSLKDGKICGCGLDNKAGAVSLLLAMEKARCENDLYFLFSMGEETTSRGVSTIAAEICPDIAIVVDAGFASAPGLEDFSCIQMDAGPSVSITDTLSRPLSDWVISCAEKNKLPLQIVCEPGGTGTSATKLALQSGGIPCVVVSFPLKNMHTPSEIVSEKDIIETANLISALLKETKLPCGEVKILG